MMKKRSTILVVALIAAASVLMLPIKSQGGIFDKIGSIVHKGKSQETLFNSFQSNMVFYLLKHGELNYVPRLAPGVLPVDANTNTVDQFVWGRMKASFKPNSANNVSFVVAYKCRNEVVGHYTGSGSPGYQTICKIRVIDVRTHYWGPLQTVSGSEPPHRKKGRGSATGSHPVVDWLKSNGVI